MPDDQQFTNIRPIAPPKTSGQFTNIRPLDSAPQSTGTKIKDSSTMQANVDPHNFGHVLKDPFKIADLTKPIESYTQEGRKEHPVLSRVGDVTSGLKELLLGGQEAGKPMGTRSGIVNNPVTATMSVAGDAAALGAKAEQYVAGRSAAKAEAELIKINKALGVGAKDLKVGRAPGSMGEFVQNPARVMQKAGVSATDLAKMKPLERLQKIDQMKQATGQQLDSVLNAASGKPVNVSHAISDTLDELTPAMRKQTATKLNQILIKEGITDAAQLQKLTPMQVRTIQRRLDDFANFSSANERQSFADIASELRRKFSRATVEVVPEAKQLDQDYTDLSGASKAVTNQVSKYARIPPKTTLQKVKPYAIGAGGAILAGGLGVEAKHLLP